MPRSASHPHPISPRPQTSPTTRVWQGTATANCACEEARRKAKLVKAAFLAAQSVKGAFTIVKAGLLKSLGIIKTAKICSGKISAKIKQNFTSKHFGKTIKEQIFTILLTLIPQHFDLN